MVRKLKDQLCAIQMGGTTMSKLATWKNKREQITLKIKTLEKELKKLDDLIINRQAEIIAERYIKRTETMSR